MPRLLSEGGLYRIVSNRFNRLRWSCWSGHYRDLFDFPRRLVFQARALWHGVLSWRPSFLDTGPRPFL